VTQNSSITPSQTVGPFFHPAMLRTDSTITDLTIPNQEGQRVRIRGQVIDGAGDPVPDAGIEIWQANEFGHYATPSDLDESGDDPIFLGYGRCGTGDSGDYEFHTIKPGRVPFDSSQTQAPHLCVVVYARGLLNHLVTRIYFDDDQPQDSDPILQYVPEDRRETLIARKGEMDGEAHVYHFNIVLQGENETVFFNV
jgi:protocatechuate 3,4-dioxygenase, alpha subunit